MWGSMPPSRRRSHPRHPRWLQSARSQPRFASQYPTMLHYAKSAKWVNAFTKSRVNDADPWKSRAKRACLGSR